MSSIIEQLKESIRSAAIYNPEAQAAPSCILWPDKDRQWEPVIPRMIEVLPELCVLGEYDPTQRKGPAIWLRCAIAGKCLEDVEENFGKSVQESKAQYKSHSSSPSTPVPIIYLPGIGRHELRDVEGCPENLKPLVELQFRGVIWSQVSAKDWTVLAYLMSDQGGLGLDVAQEKESKHAMLLSLNHLLDENVSLLENRYLDKDFFNQLLTSGDPTRELLEWIDSEDRFKQSRDANAWEAFVAITKSQLGFDSSKDGVLGAAQKLASHEGAWETVWSRFCEAPKRYTNIPAIIRRCGLPADLFADVSGWPQINSSKEDSLRSSLVKLDSMPHHDARKALIELNKEHAERRNWIWVELEESPLAQAIDPLSKLAKICEQSLAVGTIDDLVSIYTNGSWEADRCLTEALSYVENDNDTEAVTIALQAVYKPWIEDAARHLQKAIREHGYPGAKVEDLVNPKSDEGTVYLFVDGLRYDIGKKLCSELEAKDYPLIVQNNWAALPSVTATAKPAVAPVAAAIAGDDVSADFEPCVKESGKSLKGGYHLKKLFKDHGYQLLDKSETGDASGRAWTEIGDIDKAGHDKNWKMVKDLSRLLDDIVERIEALVSAGWKHVKVVTDHGFLLLPGGLPKSELPSSLSENTWGRCAALKPGARSNEAYYSWFWNPAHSFVLADGISCYGKARGYTHGGISLQECLTLSITIEGKEASVDTSEIALMSEGWKGMRYTLILEEPIENVYLDVRKHPGDKTSSLAIGPKKFKQDGKASVVVEEDDLLGSDAFAVIVDQDDTLLFQIKTKIGGDQ